MVHRYQFKRNDRKNILFTTTFSADRNNTLTVICYERAIIDNKITITLVSIFLISLGEGEECVLTADGWVQRLLSGDGLMGQQTCCRRILGSAWSYLVMRAEENHQKSHGWEAPVHLFPLWSSTDVSRPNSSVTNPNCESWSQAAFEKVRKSQNEERDCSSSIMTHMNSEHTSFLVYTSLLMKHSTDCTNDTSIMKGEDIPKWNN